MIDLLNDMDFTKVIDENIDEENHCLECPMKWERKNQ